MRATKTQPPLSDAELHGTMAGEYRILRKLGTGGFGTVYEAEHPVLKRRAAVKVLHTARSVDSVAVSRFLAEARAANQIRHRHIVDIFSFGELPSGQHFYVMDFLDGVPLDRYLELEPEIAPALALQLLRPVANALGALHDAGIVHRDVKPANIYLAWETNGEVVPKLLDFGLVKLMADSPVHTASGVPMGTPYYMSPEQCRGEKIDARADVYAFGIICHEILTGAPPFTGDSPAGVLVAHVLNPPPRPSEARPGLSSEFDEPVLAMLAKDAAERPASMALAFERLEQAARRAGVLVPEGLPHLPRPRGGLVTEESLSSATFPATAAAPSAERDARAQSTLRRRTERFRWGGVLTVALLGAIAAYLLRDMLRGAADPAPAPSQSAAQTAPAALHDVAQAVPTPDSARSVEASAAPSTSVELDAAAPPSASAVPKAAKMRSPAKPAAVPRDLENPF